MQEPDTLLAAAKENLRIADHMANITYQIVKDPKFLVTILERLNKALNLGMKTILAYEVKWKKIPPFQDDFNIMYPLFKARALRRYSFKEHYSKLIGQIHEAIIRHKEAPVEFTRKQKLVICDEKYDLEIVSIESVKKSIQLSKEFLKEAEIIIAKRGE